MADLVLKSERQIQTAMLSKLITRLGLNDINPGSVIDVITQAASQEDFAAYYNLAQLSRLSDIDSLTGTDLENKAFEYGIFRKEAVKATGPVTVQRAVAFTKVSTTFFAGSTSPIIGATTIDVNDASDALYATAGTLILGRGTNNEETVTYSVAPVNNVNYWTITLDAGTVNNHAIEETVILAQGGNQTFAAGDLVVVEATGTNAEIQFSINNDSILLDGEAELDGVDVTAVLAGTSGNIPIGAISGEGALPAPPFTGARATNTTKFSTGVDRETEDELRDRIKSAGDALTKGVKNAILTAIVGLVDPVSSKRVVSANIVLPVLECGEVKIYIDDGTGFEPTFASKGYEVVRQTATGGETRLQIDEFPVMKAAVESVAQEFFDMSSGSLPLNYQVGITQETITFETSDFTTPSAVTAEDIVEVINNKGVLVEARTSQVGTQIVMNSISDTNETIQILGGAANVILNFPTDKKYTLNLYLDDELLSKDGSTAFIDSQNNAPYDLLSVGAYPHPINMIIDKKSTTQIANIELADVNLSNAVTAQEVVDVINADVSGAVASVNSNGGVRITSNTLKSLSSGIEITGGTGNDATNGLNFDTTPVSGVDGQYIFNRELGIVELTTALTANQNVSAGSPFTRGYLRAALPETYAPTVGLTLIFAVDGGGDQTITFTGAFSGGSSAQAIADFINETLVGATATVRTIASVNYLEVTTNTFDTSGSIRFQSTSTGNSFFSFTEDVTVLSDAPNRAFVETTIAPPYAFAENDNLIVVMDGDTTNSTYNVLMDYDSLVSAATSTTVFTASTLTSIFTETDILNDFELAFTTGVNTSSETITDVALVSGDSWLYTFNAVPTNFADFAVDDLIDISGLDDSVNNGNFIITAKGAQDITVVNASAVAATAQTGTGVLQQLRPITAYNEATGQITVSPAFSTGTPVITDTFILLPTTIANLDAYLNNINVTSLSTKADIDGVNNYTDIQISSEQFGSDGLVNVTGGTANDKLGFSTVEVQGLQGYNYWSGLIDLVHKVVYGDDTDITTYPGVGAAGIVFRILAPTVTGIFVNLTITLGEGVTLSSKENEIKSAVTGYVNNLGVGDDLVVEEIRAAVIAIAGITDVTISSPSANIVAADNELIRVSNNDITVG